MSCGKYRPNYSSEAAARAGLAASTEGCHAYKTLPEVGVVRRHANAARLAPAKAKHTRYFV